MDNASLPPADVQRPEPLTEEELATLETADRTMYGPPEWPDVDRLIADLRASRARVKELEEERDEWRDAHQSEFR